MSHYPQPPPSYSSSKPSYGSTKDSRDPLLSDRRSPEPGTSAGGIYNQPRFGDVPDDFKVSCPKYSLVCIPASLLDPQYGVSVNESSPEIRNAFVRKVYTILCTLILSPIQNHNPWVTQPPLLLTSLSNRKSYTFGVIQLQSGSKFVATPSSPQLSLPVYSLNPLPRYSGFKPSGFFLSITPQHPDTDPMQPVVVLSPHYRCFRQSRSAFLETP